MKRILAVGSIGPVKADYRERETTWNDGYQNHAYLDLMPVESAKEKPDATGGEMFG